MALEFYEGVPFRGRYCQLPRGSQCLFVEFFAYEYDLINIERLKKRDVLSDSIIGQCLQLIGEEVPSGISYLYKLQSYSALVGVDDLFSFNETITGFKVSAFYSIRIMMEYCQAEWGINSEDFMPIEETDMPH